MFRRWAGLLAGTIAALALAGAPSAQAETANETASPVSITALRNGICEAGEFCLYRDANRTGPVMDFNRGVDSFTYGSFRWPIVGGQVDNSSSSAWNRTNCTVRVYANSSLNGNGKSVVSGGSTNFRNTLVGDNQASSHDACV
jgi:hypothetical protein